MFNIVNIILWCKTIEQVLLNLIWPSLSILERKLILHSLSTKLVLKSHFAPVLRSCFLSTTRWRSPTSTRFRRRHVQHTSVTPPTHLSPRASLGTPIRIQSCLYLRLWAIPGLASTKRSGLTPRSFLALSMCLPLNLFYRH